MQEGFDINSQTLIGKNSLLHFAVMFKSPKIAKALLEDGKINFKITNKDGETAHDLVNKIPNSDMRNQLDVIFKNHQSAHEIYEDSPVIEQVEETTPWVKLHGHKLLSKRVSNNMEKFPSGSYDKKGF